MLALLLSNFLLPCFSQTEITPVKAGGKSFDIINEITHKGEPGMTIFTEGSHLIDCTQGDCDTSIYVCTSGTRSCRFNCKGINACSGAQFYSSASQLTTIDCSATNACIGTYMNCGEVHARDGDGFRMYPGADKSELGGIKSNDIFFGKKGFCLLRCFGVGSCLESQFECNGDMAGNCQVRAGKEADALGGFAMAARTYAKQKMTLFCDSDLACGEAYFQCTKNTSCECIGAACKHIKVSDVPPLVEIPPTAKCKSKPVYRAQGEVLCGANFDCNVFCEQIICDKCTSFNCNGDDSCSGEKARGLKLGLVVIYGDADFGVLLDFNGDRSGNHMGGRLSHTYYNAQRGFNIFNLVSLVCSGDNSCQDSYFNAHAFAGGADFECGDNSCPYSEIHVDWLSRLGCGAHNSCAYAQIYAGVSAEEFAVVCGEDGCRGAVIVFQLRADITSFGGFSCGAYQACKGMRLHIHALGAHKVNFVEMACGGVRACVDAVVTTTGNVDVPKPQCSPGACKNFMINGVNQDPELAV